MGAAATQKAPSPEATRKHPAPPRPGEPAGRGVRESQHPAPPRGPGFVLNYEPQLAVLPAPRTGSHLQSSGEKLGAPGKESHGGLRQAHPQCLPLPALTWASQWAPSAPGAGLAALAAVQSPLQLRAPLPAAALRVWARPGDLRAGAAGQAGSGWCRGRRGTRAPPHIRLPRPGSAAGLCSW